MAQLFKCSCCEDACSFAGRAAAIEAGWTMVEAVSRSKIKYWVICPKHVGLQWLRIALGEEKK